MLDFDGCILNDQEKKLYKGINNALKSTEAPWYVTSQGAAKEVGPLLTELTGNNFPEDSPRLFAGLSPPQDKTSSALR